MSPVIRSSIVLLFVLVAFSAVAGPCPGGPWHPCDRHSVSGVWYSDATKTTPVGGWWTSCPNVDNCLISQDAWGQQTQYYTVDCEPCDPCGNCAAKNFIDDEDENGSCILKAEADLDEMQTAGACGAV